MQTILIAIAALGAMGLIFGLVLSIAGKIFAVKSDPRLESIQEALPGANCGGCGYAGCAAYAKAILDGNAKIGQCAAGGDVAAQKIAAIMGVEAAHQEKQVAFVRCSGRNVATKGRYAGFQDCNAALRVADGNSLCSFGCLGFGTCVAACKFDAIHVEDGVAKVDPAKCTGCFACRAACPRGVITAVPASLTTLVPCASREKGPVVRKICDVGCIGCHLCERSCEAGAIKVVDNVAVIDAAKCTGCGACAAKCPRKLIVDLAQHPAEAAS